jgi:hypothetical protein
VIEGPPGGSYWRVPEDTLWDLDADGRIWWGEDGNNVPRIKRFLSEVQQGLIPQTVWDYDEVGHTQEAKQEYLRVLSDREVFTTPKPVELIQRVLDIATDKESIVLDSYAGSGTTGQAVMTANQSDGGSRRYVIVQMPYDTKEQEKDGVNIARTITAERIRRVIVGYSYKRRLAKGKTKVEKVEGLGGKFTYAQVGEALFTEYRDFGKKLPDWETLARYIFYTETGRECDTRKSKPKSGLIGSTEAAGGTSYYLFYSPDNEENQRVSLHTLPALIEKDKSKNLVIYAERVWLHGDELKKFETEHGRKIRTMVIPFGLK